ncbi:MAG TPA: hypothetical protein VH880_04425 [Anaeromyxobacteraceae bacterium]|jgi:hypothetical protein
MTRLLPLAAAALVACATGSTPGGKEPFPGAAPAAAPGARAEPAPAAQAAPSSADLANPRAVAARSTRPEGCEAAARAAQAVSRDRAWEVLRACVERGNFTLIRRLLDGAWDPELQARGDAASVIARVVAARGGDVYGDLNLLRQRRIPIFGLAPAAGHPELYQGRLLLVRARVDDVRTEKGKTTVRLSEFALAGQVKFVEDDSRTARRSSSRGAASGEYRTSRHGSGSGRAEFTRSGESYVTKESKRLENTPQETGIQALARLPAADPFFEPGRQFVVLARFDGVREVPGEEEDEKEVVRLPVLSVITYAEPNPNVVE